MVRLYAMRACAFRSFPSALLLPVIAACGAGDSAQVSAVVRDSAGIAIVQNPSLESATVYSVSGPVLDIGVVESPEEYALHDVSGIVRLSDGSIAVAVGGSEIRWFDANGEYRQRTGRDGEGPGEFRRIRYVRALAGDSLLVFDSNNRRVSVLRSDGGYVRGESTGLADERPLTVAGALRDGTLLTRTVFETPPRATPMYRVRIGFAVSRGDTVHALRTYLGPDAALHAAGNGGGIESVFISVLPFARAAHATAGPDRFFVGSSDSYEIDVWDATGRLVRIIRVATQVQPVTEEVRQNYIEGEVERRRLQAEERGQRFEEADTRRLLLEQTHAPSLPTYSGLLATADGRLWVREFRLPGVRPAPERWTVFDAEGLVAGVVDLPPGFTPMYIDRQLVLGVFRGELDVPYVRAYTID